MLPIFDTLKDDFITLEGFYILSAVSRKLNVLKALIFSFEIIPSSSYIVKNRRK